MTHSLIRSLIHETLLTEALYGAQAIVYHGTRADPLTLSKALISDEFSPGEGGGAIYGKGFYGVYELEDSDTGAGVYGENLIKAKVNLHGYIIFDPATAKAVYGKALTPANQAKNLGYSRDTVDRLQDLPRGAKSYEMAKSASNFLRGRVKGIAFNHPDMGPTIVAYDPATVLPLAYKAIYEKDWHPIDRSLLRKADSASGKQSAIRRSATGSWRSDLHDTDPFTLLQRLNREPDLWKRVVSGDLDLYDLKIKRLPDGLKVHGTLDVSKSSIESLPSGLFVLRDLIARDVKKLTALPDDIAVGRRIDLSFSPIARLPEKLKVNGDLLLDYTSIKALPRGLVVERSLSAEGSSLESLPDDLKVGRNLMLSSHVKSLPGTIEVGGNIIGFMGPLEDVPSHLAPKLMA
jgi:hypothetical protein